MTHRKTPPLSLALSLLQVQSNAWRAAGSLSELLSWTTSSSHRPPGLYLRGPRFLFLMETTGFLSAMGISSACRRLLFNLRSAQDLLFWEKSNTFVGICGILVSLLCPLSFSCYCWGGFASVCARSAATALLCRFIIIADSLSSLSNMFSWFWLLAGRKWSTLHFTC